MQYSTIVMVSTFMFEKAILLGFSILFFLTKAPVLDAQSNIPIGAWKSYLPYQKGVKITQSDTKIIYATDWSLFTIDKEDESVDFISKVDGLSDVGINLIEYDSFNDQLIVIYDNSNIDILKNDQIINVTDLLNNVNIVGDRSVEDVHIANAQYCYLATAFGIVEYDLQALEFGFTAFTDVQVYDITTVSDYIYAATDDGVYYNRLDGTINLADFSTWGLLDESFGLPVLYESQVIGARGDQVYIATIDSLFIGDQSGFDVLIETPENFNPEFLKTEQEIIIYGMRDDGTASKVLFIDSENNIIESPGGCINRLRDASIDEKMQVWYGDDWRGIRRSSTIGGDCTRFNYNSPLTQEGTEIDFKGSYVYVASGGASESYGYTFTRNGFYAFEDGQWSTFNETNVELIQQEEIINLYSIAAHPSKDKLYIGSFWNGIIERDLNTDDFTHWNVENSSLDFDMGDQSRIKVTSMEFDDDDNLWVANFGADQPLSVLTSEGNWFSFDVGTNRNLIDMVIDPFGYKWMVSLGSSGGLYIFDDNNTINDPTDDRTRLLNSSNSTISTSQVNCVAVDLDGDVWLGTAEGPIVFECGSGSFDLSGCEGARRKVLQDGIPGNLLITEDIRTIAVDGANRKWFGTRNGIFVQSADGETQVLEFNEDNSSLFDNNIIDMAFNGETGEMFILSDRGLQSYRTDALDPERRHIDENIYAFPNPVRSDYQGPIAIKGLVEDADIKITDINGKLIFETIANGGQAIWDGNDYTGRRAASGVYLVFSSSRDNFADPDAFVTKIVVIK